MLKSKKGVSPLIAAVLLIAFAVAIGTVTMGWLSTTTRATTETIGSKTATVIGCADASIQIDHVFINNSSGASPDNSAIIVKNTGYTAFTKVNGTLYDADGTSCSGSLSSLAAGKVGRIELDNCGNFSAGLSTRFSMAIVATNCGGVGDSITSYDSNKITGIA